MPLADSPTDAIDAGSRRRRMLRHPNAALVTILTCQLMMMLDATIVNIALPDIQSAVKFSAADLSWVVSAYTLTFGGLLLLGARAGDILGRRRVFIGGIALFTLASLLGGLSDSPATLLAARSAQGIGAALATPSALALLMTAFPGGRERLRAIGLYTAVSIGGSAFGLIAGGMLVEWANWRWVFFVNVPIGVALVALAREVLPETARQPGRFDLLGALTSTIGMALLVFGFVHAATDGWASVTTAGSFVIGLVLLVVFVRVELTAPSPITPLRLFANRNRSASLLARLLLVAGIMGMFFFLTQFLQDVLNYSPVKTGLAFLPLTLVLFAASQVSARYLIELIGARILMTGGIICSTTGVLLLSQLSSHSSYISLLASLVLFGFGNGIAFVPLTATSLDGVAPADSGAASGLVNVMQQVGGSLGLAVLVTVFGSARDHDLAHPKAGLSPLELTHHAFVVGADRAFTVAAIFLALTVVLVGAVIRAPARTVPAAPGEVTGKNDADAGLLHQRAT